MKGALVLVLFLASTSFAQSRFDGTWEVAGYAYDTLAVRVLDNRSINFTMKKEGKTTFACVDTVSADERISFLTQQPTISVASP